MDRVGITGDADEEGEGEGLHQIILLISLSGVGHVPEAICQRYADRLVSLGFTARLVEP